MAEERAMPPDAAALMLNTLHEKRYIADTLSVDDPSHDWNFVFSILFGFGCPHFQLFCAAAAFRNPRAATAPVSSTYPT